MKLDDWIGKPYAEGGQGPHAYDCLGLAKAVLEAAGYRLPKLDTLDPHGPNQSSNHGSNQGSNHGSNQGFEQVALSQSQPLDCLLFRQFGAGFHVGLIADRRLMLHTTKSLGAHLADYHRPYWASRLIGVYRCV